MLKDYQDGNRAVLCMHKGTSRIHNFFYTEESGSVFNPNNYTIVCEVRLCSADFAPAFTPEVSFVELDGRYMGMITFLRDNIHTKIRENRLYWRVLATPNEGDGTIVINRGEIFLKEI